MSANASAVLSSAPDAVFGVLTDPTRLPEWNEAITRVLDRPAELVPGSEWVVEMHALGQSWLSRARLEVLDPETGRFVYRACTDDGNPSYAHWEWTVSEDPAGSRVTVSWELHPLTFWRRVLLVRIRARQLRTEVPKSLRALGVAAAGPRSVVHTGQAAQPASS